MMANAIRSIHRNSERGLCGTLDINSVELKPYDRGSGDVV